MSHPLFDAFPGGRRKALVMSYDDGCDTDRRLVEIFNRHGILGTFHLNSGWLDGKGFLRRSEVKSLFAGHEVSVHTVNHPHLPHLSNEGIIQEIMDDRRALESLVGYPIRGMSYPGGGFDDRVIGLLPGLGIEYARTVNNKSDFLIPDDYFRWPTSCHHAQALEKAAEFRKIPPRWSTQVLYVWGHSADFEGAPSGSGWDLIEKFCALMAHDPAIWYTTHIELVDYMNATRRMRCSADGRIVQNPNSVQVWMTTADEKVVCVEPGKTVNV